MLSRRHFIIAGAITIGGAATGIQLYRSNVEGPGERAVNRVIENLAALPGAVRFGEMFRKKQGSDISVVSVKSISERLHKAHGNYSFDNINDVLEQQIQIELRTNQVQLVDDWFLTRTEAELCALASFIKSET